jgi:hypothetical protein
MLWSNVLIGIYVLLLLGNGYSWYKYSKKASADQKKKEGWINYYVLATIFILMLLFQKTGI